MIDLHLHILPGVDDGPPNLREATAMLDWMAGVGYSQLVATPHLMEPLSPVYAEVVTSTFRQVAPLAHERGIVLHTGFEHMVAKDLPQRLAAGEPSTLAGSRAVLMEVPFVGWDYSADRVLYDLQKQGFRPILAHPERYIEALARPELVQALAERGVILQLTLAALAGTYGSPVRDLARRLLSWSLDSSLPFLLATDAHSSGRRLTDSLAGRQWIERNVGNGRQVLEWAGHAIPAALIEDQPVPTFDEWVRANPLAASTRPTARKGFLRSLNPLSRS
jgi:protein-tyrosine phosphatase